MQSSRLNHRERLSETGRKAAPLITVKIKRMRPFAQLLDRTVAEERVEVKERPQRQVAHSDSGGDGPICSDERGGKSSSENSQSSQSTRPVGVEVLLDPPSRERSPGWHATPQTPQALRRRALEGMLKGA